MDDETISLLETVCVAGGARSGYSEESNLRLEQLVKAGLLAEATPADPILKRAMPQSFYRPTKRGVMVVQQLKGRSVA
jgi:hypothetical protein